MKKGKLLAVMAAVLCVVLLFAACGGGGNSGGDGAKKIAYFGPHQDNEYQISLREAVESFAKADGLDITVYIADNDPAKQVSQIEQALAQGVDGIIIDPVSFEGIASAVAAANEKGVPFVTIHESVSNQELCTALVASDLRTGGKLKMEQVMKDFPNGAQLAVLYGPLGHTAQIDITDGYEDVRTDAYEIVFDGEGNWNAEDALELVSNWLSTGKQIDAIVCNNDGMAIGALQACKAAGKTDILIYGLDAQQDVLAEVKAGTIRATIFNDFEGEARQGLNALIKAMNGETVEKEIWIDPKVVTGDNVDQYLK